MADARGWAIGLALFLALLPAQLFVERQFMAYAVEGFLVALCIFLAMTLLQSKGSGSRIVALMLDSLLLGLVASVWNALALPALLAWCVIVAAWLRMSWPVRSRQHLVIGVSALLAATLCAGAAPTWLASKDDAKLGTWSVQPIDGTVLFSRLGPLISCDQSPTFTTLVADAVRQVCGSQFTYPNSMWQEWHGALNESMTTSDDHAATQGQLRTLAIDGALHHPGAAVVTIGGSLVWELAAIPISDMIHDTNGASLLPAPELRAWFMGATSRSPNQSLLLRTAASDTRWLARLPLWGILALLAYRGAMALLRRRRKIGRLEERAERSPISPLHFWTATYCATLAVGLLMTIALGAIPIWSYWLPTLPAWLVLFALALPRTGTSFDGASDFA